MSTIIDVRGLSKKYGDRLVVNNISFYVERGSLFAFLGPNGAGKSTTISMLSTQIAQTAGSATVDGFELGRQDGQIRRKFGIVFQESVLDKRLTVFENAYERAAFYGLKGAERKKAAWEAIRWTGAEDFARQRYGRLSGGQRRKADIARALVHTPDLLFLDEPTTGLDPASRQQVWQTVDELRHRRGMTIFLTTHYMEEAAGADYVVVLDHGQITAKGTPAELREQYTHDAVHLSSEEPDALEERLKADGVEYEKRGGQFEVPLAATLDAVPIIERYRPLLSSVEVTKGSMEQAFLNLIGEVDDSGSSRRA